MREARRRPTSALIAAALCACVDGTVSIGADARDAAADITATDVTAADVTATDVTAPVDAMPPPGDGAPMPPRMCAVTAECVGACPMAMRACVCAPTMMGLRCLPSCVVTADCPPNPSGAALVCRMGLCLL